MTDAQRNEAEEAMLALAAPLQWQICGENCYAAQGLIRVYSIAKSADTEEWYAGEGDIIDPFAEAYDGKSPAEVYLSLAAAQNACSYFDAFGKWK